MIKEFKDFIMRGSVLDLAVGVVIGSAFTAIVSKVVDGLITPLISLIFVLTINKQSADDALGNLVFPFKGIDFKFGDVISAVVTFLITAFVLFLIVKTANKFQNKKKEEDLPQKKQRMNILSKLEIYYLLKFLKISSKKQKLITLQKKIDMFSYFVSKNFV